MMSGDLWTEELAAEFVFYAITHSIPCNWSWAMLLSDCYYLIIRWYLTFIWIGIRQNEDYVSVKEPELFVLWFPSTQVLLITVHHTPVSYVIPANWPLDLPWQYCHGLSLFLEYFSIIFVVYVMKWWHDLNLLIFCFGRITK